MNGLARALVAGAALMAAGCDADAPSPPALFDQVVQLRDVAASDGYVFLANDVATAIGAPPGTVDAARIHDLIVLERTADGYAAAGYFDTALEPERTFSRRVVVDGVRKLAYLALGALPGQGWVQILDVADPAHPVALHRIALPELVSGLGASGDRLVVAGPGGLRFFDVSDPSAPVPQGSYTPLDDAGIADVAIVGDRVYVAATGGASEPIFLYPRLLVLDGSDPLHPALLGEARLESGFQGLGLAVAVRGSRVYLLGDVGFAIFDATDPARIDRLGALFTTATQLAKLFVDFDLMGELAVIATRSDGIRLVDVRDPSQPIALGTQTGTSVDGSVAAAVAVAGGEAFHALSRAGVQIIALDADGDGVPTALDDCPRDTNPDQADADFDSIGDACDDCIETADFSQYDADGDGYGNRCDPDLDNDGRVDFRDLARLKQLFFTSDAVADLDGDGLVNFADLAVMKQRFFGTPGPSGKVSKR